MDRFGTNVKTRHETGKGLCTEIYLTYHCGCEYSSSCLGMGEGFEQFCEQHRDEAERIQVQMEKLIESRRNSKHDAIETERINYEIDELAGIRRSYYDKIKGLESTN